MRLKTTIWVTAYLRRCQTENMSAVLRRRGAEEAGAVFVKIDRLDGTAWLFAPAPQSDYDESRPAERLFVPVFGDEPRADADIEARLKREISFDPDIWIIECESRDGRHFLDLAPAPRA